MPRQTSIQLTEATEQQVTELQKLGFGTFTDIVRIAIDRMARTEKPANARRHFSLVARTKSIYAEVQEFFGTDYDRLQIIEANSSGKPYQPLPEGAVIIGSTTAHPASGPWFVIAAPVDIAEEIITKHQ